MGRWQRYLYQPVLPLGEDGRLVTGSEAHIALSRRAAGEGMVLLKNEQELLPLAAGTKVALFGKGTLDYVKGGGGSGDVTVAYVHNLYDGMKQMEGQGKVELFHELPQFYEKELAAQYAKGAFPGMTVEPKLPEEMLRRAREAADVAIVTFCRFSSEGWDRYAGEGATGQVALGGSLRMAAEIFERGDFYLTTAEEALLETVCAHFDRVAVVMNVGGMVDSGWFKDNGRIQSVLMAWQGGMEGGLATAEALCGDVNPSGKLVDTFAASLEDYPSTEGFHESEDYVNYTEDIYVGYRYFETFKKAAGKVNYPFGFGLSYTTFSIEVTDALRQGDEIRISAQVTNTGKYAGKEVVQAYFGAPQGKLGKPSRALAAFQKTDLLKPGESQAVTLAFPISSMASYDDTGKASKSAYVLEPGEYTFYVGSSVRDVVKVDYIYRQEELLVAEQLTPKAVPHLLPRRLLGDGTYEALAVDGQVGHSRQGEAAEAEETQAVPAIAANETEETAHAGKGVAAVKSGLAPQDKSTLGGVMPEVRGIARHTRKMWAQNPQLLDVAEGRMTLDEFVGRLDDETLIHLLGGQPNTGVADTYGIGNLPEYGVPNVMTADGPAGVRIGGSRGVCTTAFPCATLLACSWDPQLVEEVGAAAADELKENNLGVWLAPAVNIHRSPLCGRNFEYYSEDPLLAGKIGAAMVRGIQSRGVGACAKHFACNNKETNRAESDSRVSERALREIYLKAFEIIVKESQPYVIMTSYNLVNGVRASENGDLLTGILRGEWGYDGLVTTDWWTHGEHYLETKAGNDLKMPTGYPERVMEALRLGLISRDEIAACASRVLQLILRLS